MALTSAVFHDVPKKIRSRGMQLHYAGAVKIDEGSAWTVEATVRARDSVSVTATWEDGQGITAWCDCPRCTRHMEVCEHIWATLLTAERQGLLRGDGVHAPGYLVVTAEIDEDEVVPGAGQDDVGSRRPPAPLRGPGQSWKRALKDVRLDMEREAAKTSPLAAGHEIVYIFDATAARAGQGLVVEVATRHRKKDGDWAKPMQTRLPLDRLAHLSDARDRQALALLWGAPDQQTYYQHYYYNSSSNRRVLTPAQQDIVLPLLCATGRALLRPSESSELMPLVWDSGGAWQLWLTVTPGERYVLSGELRRGAERLPLGTPHLLARGGLVFWENRVAPLDDQGAFTWTTLLRRQPHVSVPAAHRHEMLSELLRAPYLPRLDLPADLSFQEIRAAPQPVLKIKASQTPWGVPDRSWLSGELSFDYAGQLVPAQAGRGVYDPEQRVLLLRDREAERALAARLQMVGFQTRHDYYRSEDTLQLAPRNLPRVVRMLVAEGWRVEAEGKLYRQASSFQIEVTTSIDWFELHGGASFGDQQVSLPALLAALKRGDGLVTLGDGTVGMLPEAWLKKYGLLAGLGSAEGDHLRFSRAQVGLLDALIAEQPEAKVDEQFEEARQQLQRFQGIAPADPPPGFVGTLRGYQHDGLGWLHFLRDFRFGGCLADDMGLGKTVQVLALLEARRELRAGHKKGRPGPSLVVVPRSLVFNWQQEAARFTPQLRVLDHTGIGRAKPGAHFEDYDVILTTYGTLRRDIVELKEQRFDYAILDEAQAIKNASSQSAKAARLLHADQRLVMSGTPVENHLGELWSLFEFLNPGMLGSASVLRLGDVGLRNPSEESRALLAKVLRPFLLRRTKEQVARDLPEKTEQTLYCDLDAGQRELYDELRSHYREALLSRVDRDGIKKSKIQILEALLRLRQAACHPGLIDKNRSGESSAKLDALIPQLQEVFEEGHKTLVFSQFTSLLAIVKQRLDAEKVTYEYLDGRTRDRQARVERFQSDPECRLFLISLKAGGLGLNLTMADYVFLLDPWWNPAVESQAIDRAHRIGQTRPVFAYRLIARDTVEEKVLQLQEQKRALADAIITADNSVIRDLGREDLELLLS